MIKEKDVIYMELSVSIDQNQLKELLLQVGLVRPVFIWGAPGIGKSAIVEQFDAELGLPCVCLTGSQLAPEDLIGVPQMHMSPGRAGKVVVSFLLSAAGGCCSAVLPDCRQRCRFTARRQHCGGILPYGRNLYQSVCRTAHRGMALCSGT